MAGKTLATLVQEQRRLRPGPDESRPGLGQVGAGGFDGCSSDRNDALLRALADAANGLEVEVQVVHVQRGQLGDAQSRRVEELEHRPVTQRGGSVGWDGAQQAFGIWMTRAAKQIAHQRFFNNLARVHHGHAVSRLRHHAKIVRNEQ